jgi:hypothetical protein
MWFCWIFLLHLLNESFLQDAWKWIVNEHSHNVKLWVFFRSHDLLRRIRSMHPQYKMFNAILEQKPYFGRRDEGFLFEMSCFLLPKSTEHCEISRNKQSVLRILRLPLPFCPCGKKHILNWNKSKELKRLYPDRFVCFTVSTI